MDWFLWLLVGWWAFGVIMTVSQIGKPRKPIEPLTGVVSVIIAAALTTGLLVTR